MKHTSDAYVKHLETITFQYILLKLKCLCNKVKYDTSNGVGADTDYLLTSDI